MTIARIFRIDYVLAVLLIALMLFALYLNVQNLGVFWVDDDLVTQREYGSIHVLYRAWSVGLIWVTLFCIPMAIFFHRDIQRLALKEQELLGRCLQHEAQVKEAGRYIDVLERRIPAQIANTLSQQSDNIICSIKAEKARIADRLDSLSSLTELVQAAADGIPHVQQALEEQERYLRHELVSRREDLKSLAHQNRRLKAENRKLKQQVRETKRAGH